MNLSEQTDLVTQKIIGAAIEVHRELGPGLLESTYEATLAIELQATGLPFQRQLEMPVIYKGNPIEVGYRLDFLIDSQVVVELKSVKTIDSVHQAQILSYLKLGGFKRGLLINFNVPLLENGIQRFSL